MAVDFDAYEVLKIDTGVESTEAEVRRAYRKRAIETHPDKNRSRSNAADEFDRVRRAYELLMDKEARAAHDHLIRRAGTHPTQNGWDKRRSYID
eukprot:jgi/Pico_ML_1/55989/g1591.t1